MVPDTETREGVVDYIQTLKDTNYELNQKY